MKKIAWLAPILIAGPLAFAACDGGGTEDVDGSGGSDGTGGNDPTGGNGNDGTGGGSGGSGGSTGGSSTGGMGGGLGGLGGADACAVPSDAEIGMGGFGGGSTYLVELCEARCSYAIACGAAGCDEEACVTSCSDTYPYDYYYNCLPEYAALKACEVENLVGDDYGCDQDYGVVFATESGTGKCESEWADFNACLYP